MEIEAYLVRRKIDEAIADIANRLMNGVDSWDEYNRLVGRASALFQAANIVKEQEVKVANNGDLFGPAEVVS